MKRATEDFWNPKTLEQIVLAQQVQPVADLADLAADFWPAEETADDLIEYIHQQRHEDAMRY